MIIKKPIKLTPRKISRGLTIVIVFLFAATLILVSIFLYKNFYQTIIQGKEIIILREKVALDTINMEKFNAIIDKLTKKAVRKKLGNVTSPFH
jgi:hypothetical protein